MFVSPLQPKAKRRFRVPPALAAMAAVLLLAVAATAQSRPPAPVAVLAADASGPTTTTTDRTAPEKVRILWELFWKGGPVMWVLLACSVVAVAIIFERLYALRRSRVIPPRFLSELRTVVRDPRYGRDGAVEYCRRHDSPIARMVGAFFRRLPRGFASAEKALEDAGGNEALKLRQNLRLLYAIGSAATLLGLIGTIAGMIQAFRETARLGDADNKVEKLSTGIYQAMVCTFGGLAVAVLVTVFYYYFVGRVERLVGDVNDVLADFSEQYDLNAESPAELGATAGLPGVR